MDYKSMISEQSRKKTELEKLQAIERLEFITKQRRELFVFDSKQAKDKQALIVELENERRTFTEKKFTKSHIAPTSSSKKANLPMALPPIPKHRQASTEYIAKKPIPPPVPRVQDPLKSIENNISQQKKRTLVESAQSRINKKIKSGNSSLIQTRLFSTDDQSCETPLTSSTPKECSFDIEEIEPFGETSNTIPCAQIPTQTNFVAVKSGLIR
ncbi:unnamed protein product [Brachionus calyciflorus]|uniref:Uncharacterized protein n=1 Tax=Brachionus calyciflorus TaxID=104777 RepID=A0A814M2U6_9BILA|nr:unnamed protein product [Brachionus calyciflorus]